MARRIGNTQQEGIVSVYWLHFATVSETIISPLQEGFIFVAAANKAGNRLTGALLVPVIMQL